jgi:hypothetical protein
VGSRRLLAIDEIAFSRFIELNTFAIISYIGHMRHDRATDIGWCAAYFARIGTNATGRVSINKG